MATRPDRPAEPELDPAGLYREEVFTDRRIGSIRRLTPVEATGTADAKRDILYVGETQVMSSLGALPIVFEIDAKSLDDAIGKFGPLAKQEIERTVRELQEMRRQSQSGLVIPQGGGAGLGGMPGMPGGGGKIQLP